MFFTLTVFCQRTTGIRGGLNLSNNLDYGEGNNLGWHFAVYKNVETYKTLAYKVELKVQRIGFRYSEYISVSEFYANLPLLLDVRTKKGKGNSYYFGIEPGIFVGGQTTEVEGDFKLLKNKYQNKNYNELTYDKGNFNFEGVIGHRMELWKMDLYLMVNLGLITPDIYFSISIGI